MNLVERFFRDITQDCIREGTFVSIQELVKAITAYTVPAARPANSSLCTGKLESAFGLVLPDWRDGVARVIELLAFK